MSGSNRPTLLHRPAPTVVVVGGSESFVKALEDVVREMGAARMEHAGIAGVVDVVTKWRPFAIVVGEDTYQFTNRQDLNDLARDVRAQLFVITPDIARQRDRQEELVTELYEAFLEQED